MASVLEGAVQLLQETPGVSNLVGERVSAEFAPQNTSGDYITVSQSGGEPQYHSTGESGLQESQLSIKCYGASIGKTVNIAEQVRLALSGRPAGDIGGANGRRVTVEDIRDAYISPSGEGDQVGSPAREVLVTVWHNTTIPTF